MSLKNRLKILFGYNVLVNVTCISQHSPGTMAIGVTMEPTKHSFETLKANADELELLKVHKEIEAAKKKSS